MWSGVSFGNDYLQPTTIQVLGWHGPLWLSAIYCPPRQRTSTEVFSHFFGMFGSRYKAEGDGNAKH